MNQLAITIRKLNDGNQILDDLELSLTEQTALQVIGDLIHLSPQDLMVKLSQQSDPSEWIAMPTQPQHIIQI